MAFIAVTGFRPVHWTNACLLSVAPYKITLILRIRKIYHVVSCTNKVIIINIINKYICKDPQYFPLTILKIKSRLLKKKIYSR